MTRDTCRWVLARLPLLAGGELIGLDRRRVERHLVACARCRARLDQHHASLHVLHTLAQCEPPTAAASSLWPALQRQIAETRRQKRPWTLPIPGRWIAAAATLALLGAAVAWHFGRHYQLVVGLRPRIARVDPRPVFRPAIGDPSPPIAANTTSNAQPSSPPLPNPPKLSSTNSPSPRLRPNSALPTH